MPIEDVFTITGRGVVVSGRVECGDAKIGDEVEIVGLRPTIKTIITGVERFIKLFECANNLGDHSGLLLGSIKREDVERGQVLATSGFITAHTKFQCMLQSPDVCLDTWAGGNYDIFVRMIHISATIEVLSYCTFNITLKIPIAMEEGHKFLILEPDSKISDQKIMGTGVVAKIIK